MSYTPSVKSRSKTRKTYNIGKRTGKPIYEPGNMMHILNDAVRPALPPGWRKSANGNWYYEARVNRADNTSDDGYIVYMNPKTGKQVKIKDTKANRDKLSKMMGKKKRTATKKTATKKTTVKVSQPKKKATPRPKIRRTGLHGSRAKAKVKSQAYKRTAQNKEKTPFELSKLFKGRTTWFGYINTLTGNKKSFAVTGTLKTFKFRIDNKSISESGFDTVMSLLKTEGIVRPATSEEKKAATRHLMANGWTKYDAQREYINNLVKTTKKAQAKKEADAKKRAENKKAREERQKKALEYKTPAKPSQPLEKVDATPTVRINENLARTAKEMRSFSDYKSGSATSEYNSYIRQAAERVNEHKAKVDPIHWPEIDSKFELYKKRIGEWINEQNKIESSMPAWFIAGPSNYNVRKWNKTQAREDAHYKFYQEKVEGLLNRILRIGASGAISSDDKQAVQKIDSKLEKLERDQELMKMANAYYRKHKTLDGSGLPKDIVEEGMKTIKSWNGVYDVPFPPYALQNNNANIRRLKERNAQLKKMQESPAKPDVNMSWGTIVRNKEENRLQLLFNTVPDADVRTLLKSNGFKWSPKNKAWQRQLTSNAEWSLKYNVLPKLGN